MPFKGAHSRKTSSQSTHNARRFINERQRLVLTRLLDGPTGKLTTKKWALIAKSSHDTALRDIQGLIDRGLLRKDEGGGRSTSYSLILEQS